MHKMQFTIFTSIFLLINLTMLVAQSSSITGHVLDFNTGKSLPGANVFILGTSLGTASDLDGEYEIRGINPGSYTLRVSFVGYEPKEIAITLQSNRKLELDVKLENAAIEGEEVVVTAQAKGQMDAINKQLSSQSIVTVASSARIQEIPDANAAETVGRLPGVSISRSGGEGTQVIIRGLAPKFNTIKVNGVRMASTGANDRGVDLSMVSPYMLDGIEVMKALTPDQDADAMGGSVDFKIKKAGDGLDLDLIAQGGYNNLRSSYGDYKIVAGVSDRFFKNKLGVFALVDIEQRNRSSQDVNVGYILPAPKIDSVNQVDLTSLSLNDITRDKNRYGGTFVIDYRIPDGVIDFTSFGSQSFTTTTRYTDNFSLADRMRNYTGFYGENTVSVLNNMLNYEQTFGNLEINAGIAFSFSENSSPDNLNWLFREPQGFVDSLVSNQVHPTNIPSFARNDISNTRLYDVNSTKRYNKESAFSYNADFKYKFNFSDFISAVVKLGGKYRVQNRFYETSGLFNSGFAQPHASPWKVDIWRVLMGDDHSHDDEQAFPMEYFLTGSNNYEVGEFLNGEYPFGVASSSDLMREIAKVALAEGIGESNVKQGIIDNYDGKEIYKAAYIMTDIKFGPMIQFIPGVRYESVQTEYNGISGDSRGGYTAYQYQYDSTNSIRKNEFLLPMVHLRLKPTDWFDVRLAYTQALNRPNYNWLVPTQDLGLTSVRMNIYNINPALSHNFDMYLSVYENSIGLFTFGWFKKNITDFMVGTGSRVITDSTDAAELGLTNDQIGSTTALMINNKEDVDLWGVEFDWQTNFWYLPGILKGIVLNINYTHIFSEVEYQRTELVSEWDFSDPFFPKQNIINNDTTYTDRLVQQPNDILNVALGFDYKGFMMRISMLYQSNIFTGTNFWPEKRSSTDDYLRWDLSLRQQLPIEGLQVFYNLNNFTSASDRSLLRGNNFPTSEQYYGLTMDLGIRYRL